MAIRVTCPGCHKRFNVSEKFAGKSGPCPNCKTVIRVPTKADEVKLHGPEELGAGVRGAVSTKLIFREDAKFNPVQAAYIGAGVLVVLIVAAILGRADFFQTQAVLKSAIALVLLTPALVFGGYWFLRHDEELEPDRRRELYVRLAICSLAYILLWGLRGFLVWLLIGFHWSGRDLAWFLGGFFFVWAGVGGVCGMWCLETDEWLRGFFHHGFFLLVTGLLRWLAGMGWLWKGPEVFEPWDIPPEASSLLVGSCLVASPRVWSALARCARRRRRLSPPAEPSARPAAGDGP